ncbi:MAG: hypothetical protein F6K44_14035, partial [Moorea sp. SIO3E2]|nr:hypothetical protein [Moorena sp. SIO3E2]
MRKAHRGSRESAVGSREKVTKILTIPTRIGITGLGGECGKLGAMFLRNRFANASSPAQAVEFS